MNQVPQPRPEATPSQPLVGDSPHIAVDTGPFLCFGLIGTRLLLDRYKGRLLWTKAVAEEIENIARRSPYGGRNPKAAGLQATAARNWAKARAHLGEPHVIADRSKVDAMRARVQTASKYPTKPGRDLGESETLVLANDRSSHVLINENAATRVARQMRIPTNCALDLLVTLFQEGQIENRALRTYYERLRAAEIDAGALLPSPSSAAQLAKWRNLVPR